MAQVMTSEEFKAFLNTSPSRGGAVYNLKTCNVSRQARELLANSEYTQLAKAHIASPIKNAYYNNDAFKAKLDEVMQDLNITIVA